MDANLLHGRVVNCWNKLPDKCYIGYQYSPFSRRACLYS